MTFQYSLVLEFESDSDEKATEKVHEFIRAVTNHAPKPYSVAYEILREVQDGILIKRDLWTR